MHVALMNGHIEIAKILIGKGADLSVAENNDNLTPLLLAVAKGHTDVAKLLIDKGAEVNIKNKSGGYSPLIMAAGMGHAEIANYLIKNNADVNAKTSQGMTPLSAAEAKGLNDVATLLKSKGARL